MWLLDARDQILGLQERPRLFYEAMERLGGYGYVEEGILGAALSGVARQRDSKAWAM